MRIDGRVAQNFAHMMRGAGRDDLTIITRTSPSPRSALTRLDWANATQDVRRACGLCGA